MGQPPRHPGNHEQHREHISRETHGLVYDTTVEIHVGVKFSLNKVGVTKGYFLQLDCYFYELLLACDGEHLVGDLLYYLSARVIVLVHSVPETIEQTFLLLDALDELGNVLLLANRLEHPQDRFVGASVLRAVESASCASHGGIHVHSRRGEVPHRRSGAVEFVLRVQDEKNLQSVHQLRVGLEVTLVEFVEHVEEALHEGGIFGRVVVLPADPVAKSIGGYGWHSAQQTVDLFVADGLVLVDGFAYQARVLFGMEGGEGGHRAADNAHRVSVVPERVHHGEDVLVDESVLHHLLGEG